MQSQVGQARSEDAARLPGTLQVTPQPPRAAAACSNLFVVCGVSWVKTIVNMNVFTLSTDALW